MMADYSWILNVMSLIENIQENLENESVEGKLELMVKNGYHLKPVKIFPTLRQKNYFC